MKTSDLDCFRKMSDCGSLPLFPTAAGGSLYEGNGRGVDLRERRGREELGGLEAGKVVVRKYYVREETIFLKKIKK